MKELESHRPDKEIKAVVRQIEEKQDQNRLPLRPGHKVWELNIKEGLIREAEIEEEVVKITNHPDFGTMSKVIKRVKKKPGCLYETALNHKSADKKFMKAIALNKSLKNSKK